MKKILFYLQIVCICCFFAGCVARQSSGGGAAASTESVPAESAIPAGMRLGPAYVSALNESCYELVPVNNPFIPPQALCLRGRTWEVLPSVLTAIPKGGRAAAQ